MTTTTGISTEHLVVALTHVTGFKKACAARDAADVFAAIRDYGAVFARAAGAAEGRIVKLMGDAILMTFPASRAGLAVTELRNAQREADGVLSPLGPGCHVQIKVGAGRLACGMLGPPGDERFDVLGAPLNDLFIAPWSDFSVTTDVMALTDTVNG